MGGWGGYGQQIRKEMHGGSKSRHCWKREKQIIDPTPAGHHRTFVGEREPDVRGAGGHRHEPAVGAEGAGGPLGDGGRSGSLLEGGLLRHRLRRLGNQQ